MDYLVKGDSSMNIGAIIQARMGSTRLAQKVMVDILGKPMLEQIVDRISFSTYVDTIAIVTTRNPKDNPIATWAQSKGIHFFRGEEDDVLDRYYQIALQLAAEVIVRICSDNPLIDPLVMDKVIQYYLNHGKNVDYVSNYLIRSYPLGLDVEVFSARALERAWQEAKEPYQREHVTPYIYEHPEKFRLANVKNDEDLSYMRWTVDEEKDLEFVRAVYKRLYKGGKIFLMRDVLNLLEKEPQLMEINKGVKQKKLGE